jgi:hypothetical protein
VKLGAYGLLLAVMLGVGAAVGAAVGPIDVGGKTADHTEQSPTTPAIAPHTDGHSDD